MFEYYKNVSFVVDLSLFKRKCLMVECNVVVSGTPSWCTHDVTRIIIILPVVAGVHVYA